MGFFKGSPIKEVPQRPYAVIITNYKVEPDWAYAHLRCVEEQDKANRVRRYRIFDQDLIPKDFKIEGYASFNGRPELVLYEAVVGDDGKTEVVKKEAAAAK